MEPENFVCSDAKTRTGNSLKYRSGFEDGAFITYSFNDMFAIQPELMYSVRGAKWDVDESDGTHTFTASTNYIEIPVLAKLTIPSSASDFKPELFTGPDVAFRVRVRLKESAPGFTQTANIKNDVKSADWAWAFGVGTGYQVGDNSMITLDARYLLGLSKIDNSPATLNERDGVISVLVGYFFK